MIVKCTAQIYQKKCSYYINIFILIGTVKFTFMYCLYQNRKIVTKDGGLKRVERNETLCRVKKTPTKKCLTKA